MLKSLTSWHGGILASKIIGCAQNRRMWTGMRSTPHGMKKNKKLQNATFAVALRLNRCQQLVYYTCYLLNEAKWRQLIVNITCRKAGGMKAPLDNFLKPWSNLTTCSVWCLDEAVMVPPADMLNISTVSGMANTSVASVKLSWFGSSKPKKYESLLLLSNESFGDAII